jgi:gliding motility-associated-like protein
MKRILSIIYFSIIILSGTSQAQNVLCNQANPFCTGTTYNFPAGVNAGTAEAGANYGCLYSQPNPAWYYMQVGTSGTIEIEMHSTPQVDIDFCCWGPFPNSSSPCVAQLTAGSGLSSHAAPGPSPSYPSLNMIDCSYSTSWQEWCYLPNAVSGTFYILLITNYSNQPTNIVFSQTGGTGNTNCGILAPPITGDTVCVGQTINLHVNSPTSGATYHWTGPNGFVSNAMNPTIPNATTAMSGTYSMTITIGTQVSPAVTCNVIVNPNPIVTIGPANPTTCSGSPISLTPNSTIPYTWFTWNNGTQGTGGITVSPTTPTSYSVSGTDQNGCTGSASITVNINPDLVLAVTPSNPSICVGNTVALTASGADTYVWNPSATLSSATGTTVTASPTVATIYSVVGTAANGCTGTTSVTVGINPDLILAVSPSSPSICIGTSVDLTGLGADSFVWSTTTSLSSGTGTTVSASPVVNTTYSVVGTSASTGCTGSTTVNVTVNPAPIINITATPDHVCPGDSSLLGVSLLVPSYTWSPAMSLSSPNGQYTTARPISTTTYSVVANNNGCISTATYTLVVSPLPDVNFTSDVTEGCMGLKVHFQDLTSPAVDSWSWLFGENIPAGNTSSMQNPFHYYANAGAYDVTLAVVTIDGCKMGMTYPDYIIVHPMPKASFELTPQVVNELDPLVFFGDQSVGATVWNWYFGEPDPTHNTSFLQNPTHVYSDTGTYTTTLVVFTDFGCSDTTTRQVVVEQNIAFYIPNAFTPGADGKNPNFKPYGEGIDINSFEMRIYNRWGEQVCYTRDMEKGWDGKIKGGKLADPGIYSWILSYTDVKFKQHTLKGSVMLLK